VAKCDIWSASRFVPGDLTLNIKVLGTKEVASTCSVVVVDACASEGISHCAWKGLHSYAFGGLAYQR